jgi:creatinine amidohydrolase
MSNESVDARESADASTARRGEQVQIELLRPHEIEAALGITATVYMPLGTIEWHSHHLPVGLDGLTAHGVCVRAALAAGGLVYPTLYFGTGGGHGEYPWTVMMPDGDEISGLLRQALHRLHEFGVRKVVLFSGHFAPEQLDMIATLAAAWNARSSEMTVIARGINMAEGLSISPDHAGIFETTMLYALWPNRVDLAELAPLDPEHAVIDDFDDARHDRTHPLWGVFGPDPRHFDPADASMLLDATAAWLSRQ